MKKLLFIAIFSILLVGCQATYNIEISPSGLKENISVTYEKGEIYFEGTSDEDVPDENVLNDIASNIVYNKKLVLGPDSFTFNYSYDHDYLSIKESRAATVCYDLFSMTDNEGVTTILTSDQFKCLNFEGYRTGEVLIKIKTDYEVLSHNADKVEGNVYTWTVTNENFDKKPLKFSYKNTMEIKPVSKVGFYMKLIIAILIPVVIGFIVFIIVAAKNKSANKI